MLVWKDAVMFVWGDVATRLFLLVTATCACSVVASRLLSVFSWPLSKRREGDCRLQIRTLDGSHLYYDGAPWPVYDARFNLSLSWLYDPIVVVKQNPQRLLARLGRSLNDILFPAQRHSDTTVLINSFRWGKDQHLQRILTDCISRAPSIAAGKYLSRGRRIVLMPYGPEWKRHQSAFAKLLTRERLRKEWAKAVRVEAMVMVDHLKDMACLDDGKAVEEISRFAASSVLQIAYARRAATLDDPVLNSLEVVSKNMSKAFKPGNCLVDSCPLLDILPAWVSPWKRRLNADHAFEMAVFTNLLQTVEDRLGDHVGDGHEDPDIIIPAERCAAAQLLHGEDNFDRGDVAYLAAGLLEAGAETTAMTITAFLLGASANPNYVAHAQREIESLMVGRQSAPDFEDLEMLSSGYVSGFVREALRLTPTCSSGMAHTTTKAARHHIDVHGDREKTAATLDIPSGAAVLANIYGLHHDPQAFPDPWRFDPARWLPFPQTTGDYTHACFAFGFGRRRCPGSKLASYSVTMAVVLLLWCYDFKLDSDVAREVWAEIQRAESAESIKEREAAMQEQEDEGARLHMALIDAYITFRMSGAQVAKCVRLIPRYGVSGEDPLSIVEHTLAALRKERQQLGS